MISYVKVLEGGKITKHLLKFPMFLLETSRSVIKHLIPKHGHFQNLSGIDLLYIQKDYPIFEQPKTFIYRKSTSLKDDITLHPLL